MRKVTQSRTGENGTCFRSCIASLLDLKESQVPDFPEANMDPGVNKFLRRYGLRYEETPIRPGEPAPLGLHLILGVSPRLGQHAVVGRDGEIIWDPHPVDGSQHGLLREEKYGLLLPILPIKGSAKDAPLKGKRLHTAAEALKAKHDELKQSPLRTGNPATAYHALRQPTAALVAEAEKLLASAKLDDDPAYWRTKVMAAHKALETSTKAAQARDYGKAAVQQDTALSLAHMVIDKMRNSGRARDVDDNVVAIYRGKKIIKARKGSIYKYQALRSDWDKYGANTIAGAKAGIDKYLGPEHKEATDSAKRARLHRALDCVMDSVRARDTQNAHVGMLGVNSEKAQALKRQLERKGFEYRFPAEPPKEDIVRHAFRKGPVGEGEWRILNERKNGFHNITEMR